MKVREERTEEGYREREKGERGKWDLILNFSVRRVREDGVERRGIRCRE